MGTSISKTGVSDQDDITKENVPTTPILASQFRKLDIDPRSPSADIARTPIEVLKTPLIQSTVTSGDNSLNITEDIDQNEIQHDPSSLDPRSPTTEFHRTPIVINAGLKLHNKNLDIAKMPIVSVTPVKPTKLPEKVSRKIYGTPDNNAYKIHSPKLLGTSPVIIKPAENKRNSIIGLLETNIDFVETDLDAVIQKKYRPSLVIDYTSSKVEVTTTEALKYTEEVIEQIEIVKDAEGLNGGAVNKADENLKDTEKILDSKVFEDVAEETKDNEEVVVDIASNFDVQGTKNESLENGDTGTSRSFEVNVNGLSEALKNIIAEPDLTNTKTAVNVDEFDKKLTNLIYEDKEVVTTPKLNKLVTSNRTPLGDRNSNNQQQHKRQSIPVLKVSDKPTKPHVTISKIPVFKEKKIRANVNIQCENTPPRMKPKRTQWSGDDSMII